MSDLSDEDKALFRKATSGTRKLKVNKVFHKEKTPRPLKNTKTTSPDIATYQGIAITYTTDLVDSEQSISHGKSNINDKVRRRIEQGKMPIDHSLDLHHLTTDQAFDAFCAFIQSALEQKDRLVLVIHGKGYGSDSQYPILKNKVYQWLIQVKEVLFFCSAPPHLGGGGATLVHLKRKKDNLK